MSVASSQTRSTEFRRVLATNSTTASGSYAAPADTTTEPAFVRAESAAGYIDIGIGGPAGQGPDFAKMVFIGEGSDNDTGQCRVFGVATVEKEDGTKSYTHVLLAHFQFVLSTAVGVSGGVVLGTERYADTITRTFGNADVADQLFSPADGSNANVPAHVLVDLQGFRRLLIVPTRGASTAATSVNALIAGY